MKKKATKKGSARGKKSKLQDLAPKVEPKAGLNFAADGSVMPQEQVSFAYSKIKIEGAR
jgi:hypothetical protein